MSKHGSDRSKSADSTRPTGPANASTSSLDSDSSPSRTPAPASASCGNGGGAPTSVTERLRENVKKARRDAENEEILELMAESSGWDLEQMERSPESITCVEMFLLTLPRIPQLRLFPNMTLVKLIHIGLTSMQDLAELTLVEELWLSDNSIKRIEGLEKMTRLRRLYLQGNEITSMDGLPPLKHLKELWLCRNQIKHVDAQRHLLHVRKLRSLWLAGNPISNIEDAFRPFLSHLRELNLAGCTIYCFSQIAHVRPLARSLKKLWFADPLFGENPICRLNNYATFTIHLLGASLEQLDHDEITEEQRALAAAVYDKKHIYYSMRLRSLEKNYRLLSAHAQSLAQAKRQEATEAMDLLTDCLAPIQGTVRERQTYGGKCSCSALAALPLDQLEQCERDLSRAMGTREVQLQSTAKRLAEAVLSSEHMCQLLQERLCMELHSGGNIRLDEVMSSPPPSAPSMAKAGNSARSTTGASAKRNGSSGPSTPPTEPSAGSTSPSSQGCGDGYYDSASELLQNGFAVCEEAFKEKFGITGVRVNRVFRVVNRGLRVRFDDRIRSLEIDMANPVNRRKMVCLFSPVAGDTNDQGAFLRHILMRGMDVRDRRKSSGSQKGKQPKGDSVPSALPPSNEGVPLTNSLFLADEERLQGCLRRGELVGVNANPNVLTGQLVVSRVFLGKSVQALGGNRAASATDGMNGISSSSSTSTTFISKSRRVLLKDYSEDVFSVYRAPPATDVLSSGVGSPISSPSGNGGGEGGSNRVWYCLDRALILPEFVVDYTYTLSGTHHGGALPASSTPALLLTTQPDLTRHLRASLTKTVVPVLGSNSESVDWTDLRVSCYHLLAFIAWCEEGGSTVSQFAREETERAVDAARSLLKDTGVLALPSSIIGDGVKPTKSGSRRSSGSSTTASGAVNQGSHYSPLNRRTPSSPSVVKQPAQPLSDTLVDAYCREVGSTNLTYCLLRGRGLSTFPKELTTSAFASLTTLDLSGNGLTSFSWFALAQTAPCIETLLLQHNALTTVGIQGTRMPHVTQLNLAYNALTDAEEFTEVALCLPKLCHLNVEQNPVVTDDGVAKGGEYRVLARFVGTRLERFNGFDLNRLNKPSISRWRFHRSVSEEDELVFTEELLAHVARHTGFPTTGSDEAPPASPAMRTSLKGLEHSLAPSATPPPPQHLFAGARYDMTTLDPESTPLRFFEAALRAVKGTELADEDDYRGNRRGGGGSRSQASLFSDGAANGGSPSSLEATPAHAFVYTGSLMGNLTFLDRKPLLKTQLRQLVLRSHCLEDLSPILAISSLEVLDVADNCIRVLPDFTSLASLTLLDVSFNVVSTIESMGEPSQLASLCLSGNRIATVDGAALSRLSKLRELYLANNALTNLSDFYALKDMPTLVTIDISGNPFRAKTQPGAQDDVIHEKASRALSSAAETRTYFVYLFRQLKVLDGVPISQSEIQRARDAFAGKMSADLLAERAAGPASQWGQLRQLDLSQCALREVALLEPFTGLELLKLNHNVLTKVSGIGAVRNLRALDVAFNRLNSAAPLTVGEALKPLTRLESLSLEGNHIADLSALGLALPSLKFLNLKNNDLQYLERGLHKLPQLRELILDQNKLRSFNPDCFMNCKLITDISADDNAIRATDGLTKLHALERLSLGANRLAELQPLLVDLQGAPVQELFLVGNPIARKSNYRVAVVAGNPTLTMLDHKPITPEEREKAEMTLRQSEQYAVPANVVIDMNFVNNLAVAHNGMNGGPGSAATHGVSAVGAAGLGFQPQGGGGAPVGSGSGVLTPAPPVPRATGQRLQPLGTKRGGYYGRGQSTATGRRF